MDKTELLNRLSRTETCTKEEWEDAVQMAKRYPYSAPLRLLALAGDKAWGTDKIDLHRQQTESLYTNSITFVKSLLARAKKQERPVEKFDILKEINDYQEVSFKTAPKSVILSKFLEEGYYGKEENTAESTETIDSLGKKSIADNGTLASETLAVIYAKQGKIEKAIQMYERLSAQYPEKNSTFANRIAELRKSKATE